MTPNSAGRPSIDHQARRLLDALALPVFVLRLDGALLWQNEAARQVYGEWLGRDDAVRELAWCHPEDRAAVASIIGPAMSAGTAFECEYRVRDADGIYRRLRAYVSPVRDSTGSIECWVGAAVNRDDVSRAEEIRRESIRARERTEALLATTLARAPIGIAFVDTALRFRHVNETLAAITGMSVEEHLGRHVREVVPHLWPTLAPVLADVLCSGYPILNVEIAGETRSAPGEHRRWIASYYPVRARDETIGVGIFVVSEGGGRDGQR